MVSPTFKNKLSHNFLRLQTHLPLSRGLILCYHSVREKSDAISIDEASFAFQMNFLKAHHYRTISLSQLVDFLGGKISLPKKVVCLTFDDGYKNVYQRAFPILKSLNFGATIFLATDFVDGASEWLRENRYPEYDHLVPELPIMNWEEVAEMSQAGFDFQCHTCSHPDLTKLTDREIDREFNESRSIIEEQLHKRIQFMCYPYGFINERVTKLTYSAGFKGSCTMNSGINHPGQNPFRLYRCPIDGGCFDPMVYFGFYTSKLASPLLNLKKQLSGIL